MSMRMSRKPAKPKFAKEGIHCKHCKVWIPQGKRKANQILCTPTEEERRNGMKSSRCQSDYYNSLRRKGYRLTPKEKTKKEEEEAERKRIFNEKKQALIKMRICLKCDNEFKSYGPFNRVCSKCSGSREAISRDAHKAVIGAHMAAYDY